jgi:SAM-dependent methyltransferase
MSRLTEDPRRSADRYYLDKDPLAGVSGSILEFLKARAGRTVLDLGCGTGGYAATLQAAGFQVTAIDSNPAHVAAAARLGVRALEAHGGLPLPDNCVDTVVLIEVLEHVPDEGIPAFLREIRRVARTNVLLTVPDCGDVSTLQPAGVTCEHFLADDHVQFFTSETLRHLLETTFPRVDISHGDPIFPHLLLPPIIRRPLTGLYRLGLLRPSLFTRLFAEARLDG